MTAESSALLTSRLWTSRTLQVILVIQIPQRHFQRWPAVLTGILKATLYLLLVVRAVTFSYLVRLIVLLWHVLVRLAC
jgi:hypothetical protein